MSTQKEMRVSHVDRAVSTMHICTVQANLDKMNCA